MKYKNRLMGSFLFCTAFLISGLSPADHASAQNNGQAKHNTAGRPSGFMQFRADPRVEKRTYFFKDAGKEMYYNLFVSSKAGKDGKNPLIVTLHGLGAGPEIMMNKQAVDLAEEGGYILVAPMGYNASGWYGISMKGFGNYGNRGPKPPENLNELSEKDVMNVIDIVCREFSVDEKRIFLMGHSMGGAGTLFLGTKYPEKWAALAPIAPAAFTLNPGILESIRNTPVILVQGDSDKLVPISMVKRWADIS